MTDYWVGSATQADVDHVADNLRAQDIQEIKATNGEADPREFVLRCLRASRKTWAGRVDGKAVCLISLHTPGLLSGYSHPWFCGTEQLREHKQAFLRRCKAFAAELHADGGTLINWVDVRNRKAILWLGWMGFKVDVSTEVLYPATGQKFYRYSYGEQP